MLRKTEQCTRQVCGLIVTFQLGFLEKNTTKTPPKQLGTGCLGMLSQSCVFLIPRGDVNNVLHFIYILNVVFCFNKDFCCHYAAEVKGKCKIYHKAVLKYIKITSLHK